MTTEEQIGSTARLGCSFDAGTPVTGGGAAMSEELKALIERARHYPMTPQEIREQVIDFAYGNGHLEDQRVTREGIARAAAEFDHHREITSAT
jgi:hypothetical protein